MYELTYIVSPILDERSVNETAAAVRGFINDQKAEIKREIIGEKRKLAYPIQKQTFGYYITLEFEMEPENISEVEKYLKHQNDILRSLLLSLDENKLHQAPKKARILKTDSTVSSAKERQKNGKVKIEELDKKLEEILED